MDKMLPGPPGPGLALNYGAAASSPLTSLHSGLHPNAPPHPGFNRESHPEKFPNPEPSPEAPFTVIYPGGVNNGPYLGIRPVTVVTQVVVSTALGELPGQTECPYCQKTVVTTTAYSPGLMSWLLCASFSFIGMYMLGCCILPFFIKACKDVKHFCPLCKQLVYTYKRI